MELKESSTTASEVSMPGVSVAAPAYNEAECIESVLRYWNSVLDGWPLTSEIVVTNDGSTDATREILDRLTPEIPRLRALHRPTNSGYGGAMAASIYASRGKLVVTLDSDGQSDLAEAMPLIEKLEKEGLDAVTGQRAKKRDSFVKVVADRIFNLLVRLMFGVRLHDTNCSLKVMRGEVARALVYEAKGYAFPTEVVLKLNANGARLGEHTVSNVERTAGTSKLKVLRTSLDMWWFMCYLRRKIKLYRRGVLQRL